MTSKTEPMCVSVTELCGLLGLSKPVVYELVRRADFPSIHVGRRVLVPVDGLRAWLDEHLGENF